MCIRPPMHYRFVDLAETLMFIGTKSLLNDEEAEDGLQYIYIYIYI